MQVRFLGRSAVPRASGGDPILDADVALNHDCSPRKRG